MDAVLLDTDMLTDVIKRRNQNVRDKLRAYLAVYPQLAISGMSWYEVVRGWRDQNAKTQLFNFAVLCQHSLIYPISDAVLNVAADLWVTARRGGQPSADADLIIAATALDTGRVLATGNTQHFAWIPGLRIEDWRQP
jgi:tRNA(fMet)-specific endonuclease VapC